MRIRIGVALALATTAWLATPLAPAAADPEKASPDCTIVGTPGPDVLRGTKRDDYICGLGGDDKIQGRGGDDVLQGGGGDDLLVGGPGDDVLGGGRGDDTLNGLDNATAVDKLRCGRGEDTAKADPPDIARPHCEHVQQNHAPTDLSLAPSSVAENQPGGTAVGTLSATDPDAGDPHTFTLVGGTGSADNGSFTIVGATLRTAAPLDHETTPTRSVRVRATDAGGLSVERALTVTVTDVDDPPVAADDTRTVTEDDAATAVDVLANDTDVDGGPKSIASVTQPGHGAVVITGGGTGLTYAPAANYCNGGTPTDDFTYTLNGGDVGAVAVTVTCVNDAPVAVDDSKTVGEDASATAVDVLANDTDVENDPITISSATDPAHGTVVLTGPVGARTGLTYAPDANYCNTPTPPFDTFDYTVNGGDTATVSVTVTCVDDAPVAVDDSKTVGEDAAATAVDVLANDTDVENDPITISSATDPAHGTVVLTGPVGARTGLTYAPDANYCNTPTPPFDTFDYTINGGDTATVSVTVTCVDDAPVAVDDSATVLQDAAATAIDVLANDTDSDGGSKVITTASDPAHGTVVLTGGSVGARTGLTYQPDAGYCNTPTPPFDTFDYTLNGGDTATVSVTVTCPDTPPTAVDDSATVTEDAAATAVDVLTNDTDPDGGPKSVASVTQPANGTVVITGGGTGLTYAPNANYCNNPPGTTPDTFTYTLSPGGDTGTVSVTVTCADDAPSAVNDSATVVEDSGANAVDVLANDTDIDGGPKSVASVTQPANGTVAITGGGTGVSYTPSTNYCGGPDTFTYTLNGGSSATVSMSVTCVNDAPVADDETFNGANRAVGNTSLVVDDPTDGAPDPAGPQKTVTGDILAGDTDVDTPGSSLTVTPATDQATTGGGRVTIEADGDFTYLPEQGCGDTTDTFTYTLNDNDASGNLTDTGTVTVAIADCVWYVDASASAPAAALAGTSQAPYQNLDELDSAGGAGDEDASGDRIFLYSGSYTAPSGLPLEASQQLLTQRHGLVVPDGGAGTVTLVSAGGSNSTVTGGIVASTNNTLQGVTFGANGSGASLSGSSVGTLTVNTVTSGTLFNAVGGAVSIGGSGNTLDVALASVTSGAGTNSISLTNASGTFTAGGGSLLNASGTTVVLTGGSLDFTLGASISDDTGQLVSITGQTGGTKDFNGAVSDGPTAGDGSGVSLSGNTGATIRFDGGLNLSTGAANAFTATGGGTVVATQNNTSVVNTLTTTTGTALNVANTTIGADDLTFRSLSSNGAANGVVLNTTGATGGLTVTGNGGSCTSPASCTGGAIQSSTGAGISLTSVGGGVSLTRMRVSGGAADGVDATTVAGLAIDAGSVVNNGNAADEDGISLTNATGTISITGTDVSGSGYNNLRIQNTSGTISSLSLTNSKFNANSQTTGNHGALIDIGGNSTLTSASVTGSEFKDNFSIGLQVAASTAGTISAFTVDNNTFAGTSTGPTSGTQEIAIDASKSGTSSATFTIKNNAGIVGHNSSAINLFTAAGAGTGGVFNARVTNNTIGNAGVAGSGSQIGNCMRVNLNGDSDNTVLIDGNTLRQCPQGRGIEIIGRNGTGGNDVTVTNNNVNPQASSNPLAAILVQSNCVTVCNTVRADVRGNTVPAGAASDLLPTYLALVETSTSTLQLVNTSAAPDCTTQLTNTNTGSASANAGCSLVAGPIGTPP